MEVRSRDLSRLPAPRPRSSDQATAGIDATHGLHVETLSIAAADFGHDRICCFRLVANGEECLLAEN